MLLGKTDEAALGIRYRLLGVLRTPFDWDLFLDDLVTHLPVTLERVWFFLQDFLHLPVAEFFVYPRGQALPASRPMS